MLRYLIQLVQELSMPLLLLVLLSSIISLLKKRYDFSKPFFSALWLSVGVSLLMAFLKKNTAFINREQISLINLSLSVISQFFMIGFIVFSCFQNSQKDHIPKQNPFKSNFSQILANLLVGVFVFTLLFEVLPEVFLYPSEFLENGENFFSTVLLFKLLGFLLGIAILGFSLYLLASIGSQFSLFTLGGFFTLAVAINILSQLTTITQFLLARRLMALPKSLFHGIMSLVNHKDFFVYSLLALTACLSFLLWKKSFSLQGIFANPAEFRKAKAISYRHRRWSVSLLATYTFIVATLTIFKAYNEKEVVLSPLEPLISQEQNLVIPIEQVNDGHLHRFAYKASNGVEMRFIVIKKNDISYGVGLDACDICGPTGYYERDGKVVCKMCDVVINISTIGFKGGCNPVPILYIREGANLILAKADLEKEKGRFR